MTRKSAAASALLVAVSLVFAPFDRAVAENGDISVGVSGTPQGAAPETPEDDPGNGRRSKGKKKRAGADGEDEIIKEAAPGEKLTIRQIMQVLRTTRDLAGKNLSGLQLVGINLSRCNLKGADMSRANLERADFTESNLERVDFSGANLKMAGFFQSALTAANMNQATLDGAIWVDKRVCPKGSIGKCLEKVEQPPQATVAAEPPQPAETPATAAPAPK